MATYKLDIIQRFGKYHAAFYSAESAKKDPAESPSVESIEDVLKQLGGFIEDNKLEEKKDAIIFRNIAFDDFAMLNREVKMANY